MGNEVDITSKLQDAKSALGKNVRRMREETGLSQEDLGLMIQADQAYISRLERGILNPTLQSLVELSIALNTDLKTLLNN